MFFYLFLSLLASLCNSKVPALFHFKFFCSQDFLLHRIIESSAGQVQTLIESRRVGAEPPAMAPVRWCWREMCPPAAILRWTLSLWQGKRFLTSILSCLNKKEVTPPTQVYTEIICCGFSHTFSPWKVLFFFFAKSIGDIYIIMKLSWHCICWLMAVKMQHISFSFPRCEASC